MASGKGGERGAERGPVTWWLGLLVLVVIVVVARSIFGGRGHTGGGALPPRDGASVAVAADEPAPIPGRIGHVGGIESIALDGRRLYFGFDFGSDLALSPLIGDPDTMARFASRYMAQRDGQGQHAPAFWRELVDAAAEESGLAGRAEQRVFDSAAFSAIAATLSAVSEHGAAAPGFDIPAHLRYLLGAACGWCELSDEASAQLLEGIRVPGAELEEDGQDGFDQLAIELVSGIEPAHDARRMAAARWLRLRLETQLDQAPGNWGDMLGALREH